MSQMMNTKVRVQVVEHEALGGLSTPSTRNPQGAGEGGALGARTFSTSGSLGGSGWLAENNPSTSLDRNSAGFGPGGAFAQFLETHSSFRRALDVLGDHKRNNVIAQAVLSVR